MQLRRFDDPSEFYRRAAPFLVAREAEHNLMLGLCSALIQGNVYQQPAYLATVEDEDRVIAAALRTPPHNLILSEMADIEPLPLVAHDVRAVSGDDLVGVIGPKAVSRGFADCWSSISGRPYRLRTSQRIYRLERVRPVSGVAGELLRAGEADRDLLLRWEMEFVQEALGEADMERAQRVVDLALAADPATRGRYLWWDSGPVSMVGYAGPTPNGIRVGPVYTPPVQRARGYASAATAAVSQHLLDEGHRFVFLYTNLNNPTSNHIYQTIGYEPVSDSDEYRFGAV